MFPLADFRLFAREEAGRLEKPRWGETDPQAKFARGFGSIHVRNKSSIGFIGENYYADCDNLVKYPTHLFIKGAINYSRDILAYPIYRRFYFDGRMSGRFEFGFRLNEPTLYDIEALSKVRNEKVNFDAQNIISQIFLKEIEVEIPDGRNIKTTFSGASDALRDAYLLSSTKHSKLNQYDISTVGPTFVSVGCRM